jgi:hypothetical protein
MATVTFLVAILFVGLLISCGVVVNMYLYTQGVVRTRPSRRSRRFIAASSHRTAVEEQFYMDIAATDQTISGYVRKSLLIFLGIVVVLTAILVIFFSAM